MCATCKEITKRTEIKNSLDGSDGKDATCDDCKFLKNGDCFGRVAPCEDYSPLYVFTEKEMEDWPKEGLASSLRRGGGNWFGGHDKERK